MKRLFDIVVSTLLLALLSPVLAIVWILVRTRLGSPALFKQDRAGLNCAPFKMIKFRSMTDEKDASGALLPDEKRLSSFGLFLRATSLDELPELWNVLRGDMSLVGPRPLLMQYLPRYSAEEIRRHEVRPGITGLAQVNGRNSLSWAEKLKMDVDYVDRRTFAMDLRILFGTVSKVVLRKGISENGASTMSEFKGTGSSS